MKSLLLSVLISLGLITSHTFEASAQMFSDPIDYYNAIANEQNMVLAHHLNYISYSVHSEDYQAIEIQRQQVIKQLEASIKKLNKITPFEKSDKLKDEALAVLNLYLETFNIELGEALNLKQDSRSSFEAMEKYFKAQDKAEEKLNRASDRFEKASIAFAEKHELEFENSDEKSSRKLKKIGEVNDYTRDLFLIYFKVSKSHAVLVEALNAQKVAAMEKARRDLLTQASEAMATLRSKKGFYGDDRFLKSTKDLIEYYQSVAGDEYAKLSEVIRKQNDNKLTKEDVDYYNSTLENMPAQEQSLLNRFSENRQKLMQKHIPNTTSSASNQKGTKKI